MRLRYGFIEDHRERWPVQALCAALQVGTAGYYAWRVRPTSTRAQRQATLGREIGAIHARVKARYGSPRIHAEWVSRGHRWCVNTVAKVMRAAGIAAKTERTFRHTTDSNHDRPVAPNVLDRPFDAAGPNEAWVADMTSVPTREGGRYLAVVDDLYARRVVGWSMDGRRPRRRVVEALTMAVPRRLPGTELIAHSDRGSPSASEHYPRWLGDHGITCRMSHRGDGWDNAPMEKRSSRR